MVEAFYEPVVLGTLVTPNDYLGKLLTLCQVFLCAHIQQLYTTLCVTQQILQQIVL